ncbi:hypothetical protein N7470_005648 [Penicillium chermesinum]|nr:hypothetical protein N7470_005648 [Penicillium chermesinum]
MQKVIQRAATARKQAQSKAFRARKANERIERMDRTRTRKDYNSALMSNIKGAQQARWDDYYKKDLAPMRDAGDRPHTFGAADSVLLHPPALPKNKRRKHILFAAGDRVCVIRGRDKGKINEITQVNKESETVIVKDTNLTEVVVPEWAKDAMGISQDVMTQPLPISMDDVRHVVAVEDGDLTKDCIVEHAYAGPPHFERPSYSQLPRYTRYVSGTGMVIPWPHEAEPGKEVYESDTRGPEVAEASWVPTLDSPPFPSSVIDELRNKYSRFRTRHDPEYVKAKVMEEYRQEYLKSQSLLTPKGEKRALSAAKGVKAKQSRLDENGNVIMDQSTNDFINQFMSMNVKSEVKKADIYSATKESN